MLNILAVGPHPDDVELGMGGSILEFTETGRNCCQSFSVMFRN